MNCNKIVLKHSDIDWNDKLIYDDDKKLIDKLTKEMQDNPIVYDNVVTTLHELKSQKQSFLDDMFDEIVTKDEFVYELPKEKTMMNLIKSYGESPYTNDEYRDKLDKGGYIIKPKTAKQIKARAKAKLSKKARKR